LVLNPNQAIYHVEGFEQSVTVKDLPSPISSDGKAVSIYLVNKGLDLPRKAETSLCSVAPAAEFISSKVVTEVASPGPGLESPKIGSQRTPAPRTDGTAGDEISADPSAVNCEIASCPTRDALDEAIEELAAFKDLVRKMILLCRLYIDRS
jgi:hypothetical protein